MTRVSKPGRSLIACCAGSSRQSSDLTDDTSLPTPRTTLKASYVRVLLTCWSCKHQCDADLQGLVDGGRGDVPLIRLRWRCAECRSMRIDMVVTSRGNPQPW